MFQRRFMSSIVQQCMRRRSGYPKKLQELRCNNSLNGIGIIQQRSMSNNFQKIAYNLSAFRKYGLWRDDVLDEDDYDVQEALRRLNISDPETVVLRNFRMLRAMQLSLQKDILPKEEWTDLEDDELYLTPLVKQVIKEREEMEEWNKLY